MKEIEFEWTAKEKGELCKIKQIVPGCEECGHRMHGIGYAGCVIEDHSTYFYQCKNCKSVECWESNRPFGHNDGQDEMLIKNGWVKTPHPTTEQ